MTKLDLLKQEKVVAIIRGIPRDKLDATGQALVDGGIKLVEVTMNTEGVLETIESWRAKFSQNVSIGAGTVLDLDMARQAVAAGAEFLISPNLDEEVVRYGLDHGLEVWPGAMTPTEIVRAWKAGASAVKVFPSGTLGVGYIKEVRAPLNHIPMIATGGVGLHNIAEFFKTGITAVGLGGNLVNKDLIKSGNFAELTNLARQFVTAARQVGEAQ